MSNSQVKYLPSLSSASPAAYAITTGHIQSSSLILILKIPNKKRDLYHNLRLILLYIFALPHNVIIKLLNSYLFLMKNAKNIDSNLFSSRLLVQFVPVRAGFSLL